MSAASAATKPAAERVQWLVAKYIPDLKRREPRNVGVAVKLGDQVLSRFLGESADGTIGDSPASWIVDVDNYKSWVAWWWHSLPRWEVGALTRTRACDSYYMEMSGERLIGDCEDLSAMLDELFMRLVAENGANPGRGLGSVRIADAMRAAENVVEFAKEQGSSIAAHVASCPHATCNDCDAGYGAIPDDVGEPYAPCDCGAWETNAFYRWAVELAAAVRGEPPQVLPPENWGEP